MVLELDRKNGGRRAAWFLVFPTLCLGVVACGSDGQMGTVHGTGTSDAVPLAQPAPSVADAPSRSRAVAMFSELGASAEAKMKPTNIHVDCAAPLGGDGSANAPAHSLTAGVAIAKPLSADHSVTIEVAAGVCDHETLPIEINFPVTILGESVDESQPGGPVITWTPPSPLPADIRALGFFSVTAPARDVKISQLTIDGKLDPGSDTPVDPGRPTGLFVTGVVGFELSNLVIERLGEAIRLEASSGTVRDCSLENVARGLLAGGGNPLNPPLVVVKNNRVDFRVNGIVATGGSTLGPEVHLEIINNIVTTRFTNSGPTSPAGIRLSPTGLIPTGRLTAMIRDNQVLSGKYGIMLHGGPFLTAGVTGQMTVDFKQNDVEAPIRSLITFSNSRATVLPCELTAIPPVCPGHCACTLGVPPAPIPWDYHVGTRYIFSHTSELDNAEIDHPGVHLVTGSVLGNVLEMNGLPLPHKSFVVVPPFP